MYPRSLGVHHILFWLPIGPLGQITEFVRAAAASVAISSVSSILSGTVMWDLSYREELPAPPLKVNEWWGGYPRYAFRCREGI